MKTIFITGGCGFIGSRLINFLLKNTDYHIVNIDKLTYAAYWQNSFDNYKDRYILEKIDIFDKSELNKIFNLYKPIGIIHLAAESHVDKSIESPREFINTNIIGTYNLLDESLKYYIQSKSKDFKFLHISTDEVFGDLEINEPPFHELSPYKPSSPYSASKASSDHLVRAWHRTFSLPILITNCSNNYGPNQHPEKLIPKIILNAINHIEIPIYGNGLQIRDWLYVDDHVNAIHKVFMNGRIGETYNIGANEEKKNIDIANLICSKLDNIKKSKEISTYKDLIKFVEDRKGHDKRYAIDNTKIKEHLDWAPSKNFDQNIEKTIIWYLKNIKKKK